MNKGGNVDIGIGVDLMKINVGDKVSLKDGRVGIVTENMDDGQWVELQFPDEIELIHSQELDRLIDSAN